MTGLLLALSLARVEATQDTILEPVLVELQLGRIAARTVPAYRSRSGALIPLSQFFELAEIRTEPRGGDGRLLAILQPGNVRLTIDPHGRGLEVDRTTRTLATGEMVFVDGEVYLSTAVLAAVMNTDWEVRWDDLTVTMIDPSALPLARRLVRESLAAARLAAGAARLPEQSFPLQRRVGAGVVDYSVLAPTQSFRDRGAYRVGVGLDLGGGSFAADVQSEGSLRDNRVRTDISWTGVWRKSRLLTVLRAGDGISTGPRFRTLRGLSLTNAPYPRPSILGDLPYSATLGPGWQVEAFRGGRLIAFDSVNALGQFSVDVPIQYGENPVDFVAYGPFGEVRQFNLTYRANPDLLPRHLFEYGISAGRCRTQQCTATANLDLRYGLSRRWTLGIGLDQFWRDSTRSLFHPYADVTGSLSNPVVVQLTAVANAVIRGQVRFEPTVDLLLSLEGSRFARGIEQPLLTPQGRRGQLTLTGFTRPISRIGSLFLDGGLDLIWTDQGTITTGRIGASLQRNQFRILPAVRFESSRGVADSSRTVTYSLNGIVLPISRLGGFLGQVSLRTGLETRSDFSPLSGSLFLSRPLLRSLRAEIGGAWYPHLRGATLSLLLSAELSGLRATSLATRAPEGSTTVANYAQGSILVDQRHNDFAFAVGPSVQRAGISGRVFMDLNSDGVYQVGEPVLPKVRVQVGINSAASDGQGVYHIWDVNPYENLYVAVDTTTLSSPLWVPGWDAILVEPNPNRFRTIDVPILPGGVIEGRVLRTTAAGEVPLAAAELVLQDRRTGKVRLITTFTDGEFYAIGIRPGDYELRLSDRTVLAVKAEGGTGEVETRRFTVPPSVEGASIGNLELRVR